MENDIYSYEWFSRLIVWAFLFFLSLVGILAVFIVFPVWRFLRRWEKDMKRYGITFKKKSMLGEVETMNQFFRLLTAELRSKEEELKKLYEAASERARFVERYSEKLLQTIPVGILVLTRAGRIQTTNACLCDWLGKPIGQLIGEFFEKVFKTAPGFVEQVRRVLENKDTPLGTTECVFQNEKGKSFVFQVTGYCLEGQEKNEWFYVLVLTNVTEVRALEEEIRITERLSSLGTLAAGLAHEIRNPLSVILGNLGFLKKRLSHQEELEKFVYEAEKEVNELNRFLSSFLDYLQSPGEEASEISWDDLFEEVAGIMAHQLKKKRIQLRFGGGREKVNLFLAPNEARQILLSLVQNALDASPPESVVEVTVERKGEQQLCLCVRDEGPGMPPEVRKHAFDPFFTTKPAGRGLGLFLVYRLVQRNGGRLEIKTESGKGCRVTAELKRTR